MIRSIELKTIWKKVFVLPLLCMALDMSYNQMKELWNQDK